MASTTFRYRENGERTYPFTEKSVCVEFHAASVYEISKHMRPGEVIDMTFEVYHEERTRKAVSRRKLTATIVLVILSSTIMALGDHVESEYAPFFKAAGIGVFGYLMGYIERLKHLRVRG